MTESVKGIWLATPVAGLMALVLSLAMFFKYRKKDMDISEKNYCSKLLFSSIILLKPSINL